MFKIKLRNRRNKDEARDGVISCATMSLESVDRNLNLFYQNPTRDNRYYIALAQRHLIQASCKGFCEGECSYRIALAAEKIRTIRESY